MLDNWQRLEKIIKWTGLSINSFALSIGLKRSENLYQIKKGNNGISRDLVELITIKYPSISKGWLMIGEGSMFADQAVLSKNIPYYGVDALTIAATPEGNRPEPNYYMNIPSFPDSTFAALNFKRAMQPEIPVGSIVVLKQCEPDKVTLGEAYLIVSEDFQGIRKVRLSDNPNEYRLLPANTEEYDPVNILKDDIRQLYVVTGVIVKRTT